MTWVIVAFIVGFGGGYYVARRWNGTLDGLWKRWGW